MKFKRLSTLAAIGLLAGTFGGTSLIYAQESPAPEPTATGAPPSSHRSAVRNEFNQSGAAAESALGAMGTSIKHAYKGTKYEVSDAVLTTKVKTALVTDNVTKPFSIHVKSNEGVVTLTGKVDSPDTASRAAAVTRNVGGVRLVKNDLIWPNS